MEKPFPELEVGQRVRIVLNERNRTPRMGTIRQVIWHFKDQTFNYYLEEDGKKVSKRYLAVDLEVLE